MPARPTTARPRRRRDLGRIFAQIVCAIFAIVGAVPLGLGLLVRTAWVRSWAASETAAILQRELGLSARYRVIVHAWPLSVGLADLVVDGSDGKGPALEVARVSVRPRVFSLLAGKLDAGDIEIDAPKIRLVVKDGAIENVRYRLPETPKTSSGPLRKAPFTSVAITDAHLDLDIEGTRVHGDEIDLDVAAQDGPSFDVALRMGRQSVTRERPVLSLDGVDATARATDDDVLCQLDARLRIDTGSAFVRRLDAVGAVDLDPLPGRPPACALAPDDPRRVELHLGHVQASFRPGRPFDVEGHVAARAPVALTNRFVPFLPVRGWVGLDVDAHYGAGHTLPELRGRVTGGGLELDVYRLAKTLSADVDVTGDVVHAASLAVGFGDGTVTATKLTVEPFAPGAPIHLAALDGAGVRFASLMRDLGVTDHAHVVWTFKRVHVTGVDGKLAPLRLDGELHADTSDFEVYDKAFDDPSRRHMIGVREARIAGRIGVRPDAVVFAGCRAEFGKSRIDTTVSLGFHNDIKLTVGKESSVELSDVSPLAALTLGGRASLEAEMHGKFDDPLLTGDLSVAGLELAGFPLGDVTSSKVRFRPLKIDFTDVHGKKGKTVFVAPSARLDFDGPSVLLADAHVSAPEFEVRDFFHMWHFDGDPRFADIDGHGTVDATVHYDLGGPADRCGNGLLSVRGAVHLATADLFEEHYDAADADFDYTWSDRDASELGLDVDVKSMTLRKGRGRIFGSGTVRRGGVVRAELAADEIPLSRIQTLGRLGRLLDGTVSAVATVGGTIDELEADTDVRIGPVQVGTATLPASHVRVVLAPAPREKKVIGHTRCGQPITPPFDRAEFERDAAVGTFHTTGQLFGGQIAFDDLRTTRQRKKVVAGTITMDRLDIGAIGSLAPGLSGDDRPRGVLSGKLDIGSLSLDAPSASHASLTLTELSASSPSGKVALRRGTAPIVIASDELTVPEIALEFAAATGLKGSFLLGGLVHHATTHPELDLSLRVPPTDLSALATLLPKVDRASGSFEAELAITGKASAPLVAGGAHLKKGELSVRGLPALLSDVNVDVTVGGGELRIERATASVGGGTLSVTGTAPLRGLDLGDATASIAARSVHLPVADGISLTLDADLVASFAAPKGDEERSLPRVVGDVTLTSFSYTRPISIVDDISSITQRGKRKIFQTYDPADDVVAFDLRLRTREPLRLRNNLLDAQLALDGGSLVLAGTNQRFGMRGQLRVLPSGRIRLRANEFEVRQGYVRFDDLTRVAPSVDVTAVTEYRRYSSEQQPGAAGASGASSTSSAGGSSGGSTIGRTGGSWRITLHAYGDADNLRLEMTSDPALAQEDIALLLYIGMTRAELDQLQASSIGETAALEALSTLSGADSAVRQAVPVIDDFRFGSAYSSRTGRTEPTVTVGKRVTEQVRANVTSGLSDNREIRSNVEWRLTPRVSVQGSYDNVNDVSSSALGNLGADVRYRLEFE